MAPTPEPVSSRPTRAAVVGAGFSGIAMAIALRRAGLEEVVVFDRADELGGVWAHNTYPRAACDVPSYVYSYSFAQRRDWSRPCSPQHDIQEYLRDVAREHGVLDDLLAAHRDHGSDLGGRTRWAGRSRPPTAGASRPTC